MTLLTATLPLDLQPQSRLLNLPMEIQVSTACMDCNDDKRLTSFLRPYST